VFLPELDLGRLVHAHDRRAAVPHLRDRVMLALEKAKASLGIENPLEAGVAIPDPDNTFAALDPVDLADLFGVSRVHLRPTAATIEILDLRAEPRCERSWKRDGTVKQRSDGGMLSDRDAQALGIA